MGEDIIRFYKTKLKKEYKYAFFSTFFVALLIHMYKFTNTLPNHDSVFNYYADQNVLGSGRWALSAACGLSSYYDLPWLNGIISCVYISLTAVIIVALLKQKNPILITLIGGVLAASPATTETFFFLFTADGYMLAMLLAALAVYLSRIDETRKSRMILSGVCICIACGIYQAYVSFALVLAVCYFIVVLLQNEHSKRDCYKWVLRQIVIYAVSLAAYYIIWKLCMSISGVAANSYQGISEVGKIDLGVIANGFFKSLWVVVRFFIQWDVFERGFTLYIVLNIVFLLVFLVGLVISVKKSDLLKRKWATVLSALCLIAVVPFAGIWNFTSDSVGYRAMMLQCLSLLFVLGAVLFERWAKPAMKNIVCIVLVVIVFNNTVMANISYFYMNISYERTYAESVEMIAEIHDLQDEYEFEKMAIVGTRKGTTTLKYIDFGIAETIVSKKTHILSENLESTLLYDAVHTALFLKANFGLDLELLDFEQRNELLDNEAIKAMGCWPSGDSIAVIDDILVIKFSDVKEG